MATLNSIPPDLPFCLASQLTQRDVVYLWYRRLAQGKLAILDGDPGLMKSLVTLDLCARITTGRAFPDGSSAGPPRNTVVISAEDNAEDTIRARLQALGADLDRVVVYERARSPLYLPGDSDVLDKVVGYSEAVFVVIDPIMAFLDPRYHSGSEQRVREALYPLEQMANKHQCAVLMQRHLNKKAGSQPLYRGLGSIAFSAACRIAWLIAPDPHQPGRNVLAEVKNNVAGRQPSLAYTVNAPEGGQATINWLGPSPWSARDLLTAAGERLPPPREEARDFLAGFLANGPRLARDIWIAAQEQGLSERTLRRARRELRGRCVRVMVGQQQRTYWLLHGQKLAAINTPSADPSSLEPWIAPLREKYPARTPLDDV
jgi:hypothetical protein